MGRVLRWTLVAFGAHLLFGLAVSSGAWSVQFFGGDAITYHGGATQILSHWTSAGVMPNLPSGREGFYYLLAGLYWILGPHADSGFGAECSVGGGADPSRWRLDSSFVRAWARAVRRAPARLVARIVLVDIAALEGGAYSLSDSARRELRRQDDRAADDGPGCGLRLSDRFAPQLPWSGGLLHCCRLARWCRTRPPATAQWARVRCGHRGDVDRRRYCGRRRGIWLHQRDGSESGTGQQHSPRLGLQFWQRVRCGCRHLDLAARYQLPAGWACELRPRTISLGRAEVCDNSSHYRMSWCGGGCFPAPGSDIASRGA